jgi:hypothetical protein
MGTALNWAAQPPHVRQRALRALDENRSMLIAHLTLAQVPPCDAEVVLEDALRAWLAAKASPGRLVEILAVRCSEYVRVRADRFDPRQELALTVSCRAAE